MKKPRARRTGDLSGAAPKRSPAQSASKPVDKVGPPGLSHRGKTAPAPLDTRMIRSRDALRRGLLALLERKQFEQITIRDIAAEAGVGYATFFRHHPSKEDLLGAIAAEEIAQLMELTLPLLDSRDTSISCLALCTYIDRHRTLWSALLAGGAAATLRAEFIRLAKEGASRVRSSRWIPVELGAVYGVAATIEILAWWLHQPAGAYSVEQVAGYLDRLVVAPATAADQRPEPGRRNRP
ncbi:MAG: helix-turn-helix domain containing protein [Nevskia sp.]|nr:helix-turn-helix domain containing protein [Nevskia sp.]